MPARIVFAKEEKENIVELYNRYRSMRRVAIEIGRDRYVIQRVLKEMQVDIAGPAEHNKKPVVNDFFDSLSIEPSYFLGLFVADGWISRAKNSSTYFCIGLQHSDSYIIEKLRDKIAPKHKLIKDRHMTKLSIGDSALCLDVVKWGIEWRKKSYTLGECHSLFGGLDKSKTLNHFVRGFLDGDGNVGLYQVSNACFSFSTTIRFAHSLKEAINKELQIDAGSICIDNRSSNSDNPLVSLRYTGRNLVIRLGEWIYANKCDLFLSRKYESYLDVVKSRELLGTP